MVLLFYMPEKCQKMAPLQKLRNSLPPPGNGILGSSDCTLTLIQSNICGTVSLAIILCGLTTPEENRKKYLVLVDQKSFFLNSYQNKPLRIESFHNYRNGFWVSIMF